MEVVGWYVLFILAVQTAITVATIAQRVVVGAKFKSVETEIVASSATGKTRNSFSSWDF